MDRLLQKLGIYSLKRWSALTRFVDDGRLLVDNNWIENQIRPIAIVARTGCSPDRFGPASGPLQ